MLRDEKWLNYTVAAIKAIHNKGAGTILAIHEEIGGSPSYVAKVVASLRKLGIIDKNYQLSKQPEQITVSEALNLKEKPADTAANRVCNVISNSLNISIVEIW